MSEKSAFQEWYEMFGHNYGTHVERVGAMEAAWAAAEKHSQIEIETLKSKVAVALEMEQAVRCELNKARSEK